MWPKTDAPQKSTNGPDIRLTLPIIARTGSFSSIVSREMRHFLADIDDIIGQTTRFDDGDMARIMTKLQDRVAAVHEVIEEMRDTVTQRTRI